MELRNVLAAAALASLAACNPQASPAPEKAEIVLRTYDVPAGSAREIRNALSEAFTWGSGPGKTEWVARVTLAPDGRLIVLAPAKIHEGVEAAIKQVAGRPAAPPATVEISYWLVLGQKGEATSPADPGLAEVAEALDAVAKAQGPLSFKLVERLKLSTLSGEDGSVSGKRLKVNQEASVTPSGILARLDIRPMTPNSLRTTVQLESGKTVVLGESSYDAPGEGQADDGANLYYVIRASVPHAAAAAR